MGAYRVRVLKEAREGEGGGTYRVRTHGLRTHVTARLMLRSAGQERLGGLASAFGTYCCYSSWPGRVTRSLCVSDVRLILMLRFRRSVR